MKNRLVMLLCLCANVYTQAYALPTVIDNSAYPASAGPVNAVTPATPSNSAMLELMARMEQLQADVQQLTGKVEEQAYQVTELKKQQKALSADFDERLLSLENKTDGASAPAAENPGETPAAAPTAGVTEAQATAPAEDKRPIDAEPASAANGEKSAAPVAAEKPEAEPIQVPDNEKQEYQQAYDLLRRGRTDQSITGFNAYLSKYPSGGLANNAQYWLGEAYRVKQDNDAARKAFNAVIDNYPNSAKVPDALLKLGYIEMDQNHPDKARDYLTRVTTNYPDTPAARLAEKKLLMLNAN